jgi:hypothetical protein
MSEVRFYRDGDERRMAMRDDMRAEFESLGARLHEGPKWSMEDGSKVLAIGGAAYDENTDSWDFWLLAGKLRPRQWLQIFRRAEGVIAEIKAQGRERIWVAASNCPGAAEFIERLGFQPSAKSGVYYV